MCVSKLVRLVSGVEIMVTDSTYRDPLLQIILTADRQLRNLPVVLS
jgi:hypothetical protein